MPKAGQRPPLPTTVLGGFLGAGKTTLVNHLLRHAGGRRIMVLVNDFGEVPIDADLIAGEAHVKGIRIVTYELEGEIGFDGAGEVVGAAGVHRPATVRLLEGAQVVGDEGEIGVVFLAEEELEHDIFGFEN